MDIKIGLADTPRELVISRRDGHDDVLAEVTRAMEGDAPIVRLSDDRGRTYLIRAERIAYVEVGSGTARTVGFGS